MKHAVAACKLTWTTRTSIIMLSSFMNICMVVSHVFRCSVSGGADWPIADLAWGGTGALRGFVSWPKEINALRSFGGSGSQSSL